MAPFSAIRSKINRAITAYLISAGCGTANDISPSNSAQITTYPNTKVKSAIATPNPVLSGDYKVQVQISIKGSAVTGSVADFDARVEKTGDALMQSDDNVSLRATATLINAAGRALGGDMLDFTITEFYDAGSGDGEADAVGCDWEEILLFNVTAANANVD